jgi:HK97 gp10 family phage protein
MNITIDTSELAALAAELAGAPGRAQAGALIHNRLSAGRVEATAKSLVPVETGLLRGSITADVSGLIAEIGTDVPYAGFVEYGTSRMAPQPYMGPAGDRHEPDYASGAADVGERAVFG